MPLVAIFGMCLLLPPPHAGIVRSVFAMAVWRSTHMQDQPGNSSQGSLPAPPPADQQATRDQSIPPPQAPAATPPCQEKSQPGLTTGPDCKPAQLAGAKTRKHRRTHTAVAPALPPGDTGPTKTVVRNGGAKDSTVDLSPGITEQQASHQIDSTNQLLATSDANLKKISGRQLNANQQDTVKQIQSYMQQAEAAKKEGDVQRAHNLAVKANLLSAELVGH